MATKEYLRGHEMERIGEQWYYTDTGAPTEKTWTDRPCGHCGMHNTADGHDRCLGMLPVIVNVCCGHGQSGDAYLQFENGFVVAGKKAATIILALKLVALIRHRVSVMGDTRAGLVESPDEKETLVDA